MKKTILTTLILITYSIQLLQAQSTQFFHPEAKWMYIGVSYMFVDPIMYSDTMYSYYKVVNDTTINDTLYEHIVETDSLYNDVIASVFYRLNAVNKLYFRDMDDTVDTFVMDFNLTIGDSVPLLYTQDMILETIMTDTTSYDKVLTTYNLYESTYPIPLMGLPHKLNIVNNIIGFGITPFKPFPTGGGGDASISGGGFTQLICYSESDTLKYLISDTVLSNYCKAAEIVLSLKLQSFSALSTCDDVKINWSASIDQNTTQYVIQRSTDATQWTDIAFVPANNYTNTYMDTYAALQNTYYRIVSIQANASRDYSHIITIKNNCDMETNIHIHPNPASTHISIRNNKNDTYQVSLLDMQGRQVLSLASCTNDCKLDVSHLANGFYIAHIRSDYDIQSIKFTIAH